MIPELKKKLYMVVGTFFLIVGGIGIVLPVLPTTPFFLLAAACYTNGSKKMYQWMMDNKIFGEFLKHYYEGTGISLKVKVVSITSVWLIISISILFMTNILWIEGLLLAVAFGVTVHIILIRPRRHNEQFSTN